MKLAITLFAFTLACFAGDSAKRDIPLPQEDQDVITRALFNLNDANSKLNAVKASIPDLEKAVTDMRAALSKAAMEIQTKNGVATPGCQVEQVNASTVDAKDAKPGMWKITCPAVKNDPGANPVAPDGSGK
jgi:hypothetical protein